MTSRRRLNLGLNSPRVTENGRASSWNKTTFKTPVVVATGQKIFLSYTPNSNMLLPIVPSLFEVVMRPRSTDASAIRFAQ